MPQYNPLEGLNLAQSKYMPQEYGAQQMGQLRIGQERAEADQMRRFLEGINAMGRMYSGSALRGGIEQVLGPQLERQQQLLGNIGLQGMEAQRGERVTEQGQGWQSAEARSERDWRAAQEELNRQMKERQFAEEMAFNKKKYAESKRFSSMLPGMAASALGAVATGGLSSALGGLPSLLGIGGGGGGGGYDYMPQLDMPSYTDQLYAPLQNSYAPRYQRKQYQPLTFGTQG